MAGTTDAAESPVSRLKDAYQLLLLDKQHAPFLQIIYCRTTSLTAATLLKSIPWLITEVAAVKADSRHCLHDTVLAGVQLLWLWQGCYAAGKR